MTLLIPSDDIGQQQQQDLQPDYLAEDLPAHVVDPQDPQLAQTEFLDAILNAKRIVLVLGAGTSTACGIPDFRSANGLFHAPNAGKDLFDAHLFRDSSGLSQERFYKMIAALRTSADAAIPSPFHRLLKRLDDQGKLFRVYTQNIDALEHKAGLSYGITLENPPPPSQEQQPQQQQQQQNSLDENDEAPPSSSQLSQSSTITTASTATTATNGNNKSPSKKKKRSSSSSNRQPSARQFRAQTPRVVPLHGSTLSLVCSKCSFKQDLGEQLPLLSQGSTASCPRCEAIDNERSALRERSRGIGVMMPDVLLYNDHHHADAGTLGNILRSDLMGPRPDLLLVVGTSLKVPGTKRLVRELAKVIRPSPTPMTTSRSNSDDDDDENDDENNNNNKNAEGRDGNSTVKEEDNNNNNNNGDSVSSKSTLKTTSKKSNNRKKKTIYTAFVNTHWQISTSEWKDTFDVWYKGDCQSLVPKLEVRSQQLEQAAEARRLVRESRARAKAEKEIQKERDRYVFSMQEQGREQELLYYPPSLSQSSTSTCWTAVSSATCSGDEFELPSISASEVDPEEVSQAQGPLSSSQQQLPQQQQEPLSKSVRSSSRKAPSSTTSSNSSAKKASSVSLQFKSSQTTKSKSPAMSNFFKPTKSSANKQQQQQLKAS